MNNPVQDMGDATACQSAEKFTGCDRAPEAPFAFSGRVRPPWLRPLSISRDAGPWIQPQPHRTSREGSGAVRCRPGGKRRVIASRSALPPPHERLATPRLRSASGEDEPETRKDCGSNAHRQGTAPELCFANKAVESDGDKRVFFGPSPLSCGLLRTPPAIVSSSLIVSRTAPHR